MNRLILGDNLEVLKRLNSESVDWIYLDPPFFSNRNYEVIWGDAGEIRSFQDRWLGGIPHYLFFTGFYAFCIEAYSSCIEARIKTMVNFLSFVTSPKLSESFK